MIQAVDYNKVILATVFSSTIYVDRGFQRGSNGAVSFYSTYWPGGQTGAAHGSFFKSSDVGRTLSNNSGEYIVRAASGTLTPSACSPFAISGQTIASGKFAWPWTTRSTADSLDVTLDELSVDEAAMLASFSSLLVGQELELYLPNPPRSSNLPKIENVVLGQPTNVAITARGTSRPFFTDSGRFTLNAGGKWTVSGKCLSGVRAKYNSTDETWTTTNEYSEIVYNFLL